MFIFIHFHKTNFVEFIQIQTINNDFFFIYKHQTYLIRSMRILVVDFPRHAVSIWGNRIFEKFSIYNA